MLIAVNRPYNKSDYIPCIAWGRNARYSEKLHVGDHIKIWGRVQSREYQKKVQEEQVITKIAYEVSVSKMEINEEDNNRFTEKELDHDEQGYE
jgi:single-stranded DNA-binding protein